MKPIFPLCSLFVLIIFANSCKDEPVKEPILIINSDMHTNAIRSISTDASGSYILTASDDKTIKLWDSSAQLIKTFRLPIYKEASYVNSCSLAHDASIAAVAVSGQGVYLFDISTGEMKMRLFDLPSSPLVIKFSPSDKYLAVGMTKKGVRVYNTSNWQIQYELDGYDERVADICFSKSGDMYTTSWDGKIRVYNSSFRLIHENETKAGKTPYKISVNTQGDKIAVTYADTTTIEVLDANSLELLYRPNISSANNFEESRLHEVTFSQDGDYLLSGGNFRKYTDSFRYYFVRKWDLAGKGNFTDLISGQGEIWDIKPMSDNTFLYCTEYPDFGRMTLNGDHVFYRKAVIRDYRVFNRTHLRVDSDGTTIGFQPFQKNAYIFNIKSRIFGRGISHNPGCLVNGKGAVVSGWNISFPTVAHGGGEGFWSVEFEKYELCYSADIGSTDKIVLGTSDNLYCVSAWGKTKWKTAIPAEAWAVKTSGNLKLVVAALSNGTINWYSLEDGKLLLTFFSNPENDSWILWTPSGYYDCSPSAEKLLGWHFNNGANKTASFYPVSKFRKKYYRPDVIEQILVDYDEVSALEYANNQIGENDERPNILKELPPVVNIISSSNTIIAKNGEVTIRYKVIATDNDPLESIRVQINGRPYENIRGTQLTSNKPYYETTVKIESSVTVSIIAQNRYGYSEPSSIYAVSENDTYTKGLYITNTFLHESLSVKPKLYALVIGINDYTDPNLKLRYATKDANDFSEIISKQKGVLYDEIEIKKLCDKSATKQNILDGMTWLEQRITSRDVGIIFLSGHGQDVSGKGFYYLTVDVNRSDLNSTCVSQEQIMSTVQSVRGRILLFVDACHSGFVGGANRKSIPDMTRLVNELTDDEYGAVVFTSSLGREYSLENPLWNNGAFTKALLEGIKGNAADNNGEVTQMELGLYVMKRVPELTSKRQHPTFTQSPNISLFPIASQRALSSQ